MENASKRALKDRLPTLLVLFWFLTLSNLEHVSLIAGARAGFLRGVHKKMGMNDLVVVGICYDSVHTAPHTHAWISIPANFIGAEVFLENASEVKKEKRKGDRKYRRTG